MWVLYILLLVVIARIGYKIWLRSVDAEMHSSENWYLERRPFSMKSVKMKTDQKRKGADSRSVSTYDPNGDYESVEVFYKKTSKK